MATYAELQPWGSTTCGLHALNNVLQKTVFTLEDMHAAQAATAEELFEDLADHGSRRRRRLVQAASESLKPVGYVLQGRSLA